MIAHDMFTIYLLGLATFPAYWTMVDAAVRVYRRWRRRPEPVLCAGCAAGWGVTVVTDPGQVAPGMDGVLAWHRACLEAATVDLTGAFTGSWDELDELLPEPIGGER